MQASIGQPMQLAQAYQHCLDTARNHYENFPTASKLLRAELRPAVAAIYAFARHADDLADEGNAPASMRLKQLDAWETLLERCEQDPAIDHAVFMALGDAIRTRQLPVEELYNLLIAFRMDVTLHAYGSLDELKFYCRHSANPVGRLMLALHGVNSAEANRYSDLICTALQLINFWQDFSIDLPNGRCYIPGDWLAAEQLTADQLLAGQVDNKQFRPVFLHAIAATRAMLKEGVPLLAMLPMRLRLQIAATLHGGLTMLDRLQASEQPLSQRITLGKSDWKQLILPIIADSLLPSRAAERSRHDT
ncbi:MAG: squalene synthase HpnC [Zetaproteobacteria bacterium CG12_big_fil_rev_8_21_14_0_65_54_13]|nr:MAG: squalene synthase HpnC [Zetaproteobacteria bacterium CG12_big_fil_rev_8_21_14_0_65_54_13]PIX53806.1 MAG: squalene synthase HpnC [Zetaproteobacteria bacterium CG_4_10_14_3_um_filter_54_28]PJA30852.1 MAG: squalene synthase HpnC [Zetaproteobacteria bacterium CG_4_9_14_3_um_filter_54_145]